MVHPPTPFSSAECSGLVQRIAHSDIVVEGKFNFAVKDGRVSYIAASPADFRASYTGSALPFTSPEMALQGTPNKGTLQLDSENGFQMTLKLPNSYYSGHGTVLVPPTVYLTFATSEAPERTVAVKLNEPLPYRTLTYPNGRTSAMFYDVPLPVRSQEQILRDAAYPSHSMQMPQNHWGLKPAC